MICRAGLDAKSMQATIATHLKALAPAEHDTVLLLEPNVVVQDLAVSLRRIIISHDRQRADDGDARRVGRDEHNRVALVLVRVIWVGQADEDMDPVARVAGTRDPLHESRLISAALKRGEGPPRTHFLQLTTTSSPSLVIEPRRLVASELATVSS